MPCKHFEIRHSSFDILRFKGASDELLCIREAGNVSYTRRHKFMRIGIDPFSESGFVICRLSMVL
jgi:hypothetical protein